MLLLLLLALLGATLTLGTLWLALLAWLLQRQAQDTCPPGTLHVGFFHPHCDGGGGGERVLWCLIREMLRVLEQQGTPCCVHVYSTCGQEEQPRVLQRVADTFGVHVPPHAIRFHSVASSVWMLDPQSFPRFTLLLQSLGSMLVAWRALRCFRPHIFCDTTGHAFTFPVAKLLGGCRVLCYVHYPTISTDMLGLVSRRQSSYNNSSVISKFQWLTWGKVVYYRIFAWLYGVVGRRADLVLTNSSWTRGHIETLWRHPQTHLVYPPCDTKSIEEFALPLHARRRPCILSVGQFRPEKDHKLQLAAWSTLLQQHPEHQGRAQLVLIGGCRTARDEALLLELRALAASLGLVEGKDILLLPNEPFPSLLSYLGEALGGLHTMWNEHFGICVVEYMAAGCLTIAHNSGGPKLDIVVPEGEVGFLASTEQEFADRMHQVLSMSPDEAARMRQCARLAVEKFSEAEFGLRVEECLLPFLTVCANEI